MVVLIIGVAVVALIAVIVVAAVIAMPAFLNQRDNARQAELTSAVRNAALEVEVAATMAGGRYDAIEDFEGLVITELGRHSDAVALDTGSSLTGVEPGGFSICAEHRELDGSVVYASQEGGLVDYRDTPCP